MSKTLEKIAQHWQKAIAGDMKKIRIDEWDMDIYVKQTYPFKDESRVIVLQSQGKTAEALVTAVVLKARKSDGSRMFQESDITTLMNEADPTVIVKVAAAINSAKLEAQVEDIAKE